MPTNNIRNANKVSASNTYLPSVTYSSISHWYNPQKRTTSGVCPPVLSNRRRMGKIQVVKPPHRVESACPSPAVGIRRVHNSNIRRTIIKPAFERVNPHRDVLSHGFDPHTVPARGSNWLSPPTRTEPSSVHVPLILPSLILLS